jgi:hypothetical protein
VDIPGKGWSSPVIWGNQIWLTTATDDGKQSFGGASSRHGAAITTSVKRSAHTSISLA